MLCGLLTEAVTLFEHINASARINQLLFAGKERMALGTNFHVNILFRRRRLDHIAAGTGDGGLLVLRMQILFHVWSPLSAVLQD